MKKIFVLGMAALMCAAFTFTACSNDDDTVSKAATGQSANGTVGFVALTGNTPGTRATATTPANYLTQLTDFKVWAYNSTDNSYYMGTSGEGGLILDGDGSGNWTHRTASDLHYWPSYALNFYAIAPATNSNFAFDGQTLTYTIPTDQSQQIDLMVANANEQTSSTNSGVVQLPFQHMLSQVRFAAKLAQSNLSVEIQSITVHNVKNSVDVNLKDGTVSSASTTYENYAVGITSPVTVSSITDAVEATDDNGVLLLAPQTITGWTSGSTSDANTNHEVYLEIKCKIKSGDTYLVGSEGDYGTTYVGLQDLTWQEGHKYVYTLNFGVGKDENGDQKLTPITFTVSVADWTDANAGDITM